MEGRARFAALAAAGLLAAPSLAAEGPSVEEQLQRMQERMSAMEERLEATDEELAAAERRVAQQEQTLREQRSAQAPGAVSAAGDFLRSLEIGGWVAASYSYNFNDPDGVVQAGANQGASQGLNAPGFSHPFHPDANSFQLDQVWLEVERPVTAEHRAGFRTDLVVGKTGEILSGSDGGISGTDEDFQLYQGYVQYLAPIGEGVQFQFGKFATLIGAEVAQAPYNLNVTRGHVYNLFQPITHVGLLASTELGGGFSGALGLVNGTRLDNDVEFNKDKAVLWSLGFEEDIFSASFNGTFGSSEEARVGFPGTNLPAGDKELILDFIFGVEPSENVTAYVNADYIDSEHSRGGGDTKGYGIAAAGRVGITERLGLALRTEYVALESDGLAGGDPELHLWGVTGTADYALTDQLTVKAELRWDQVDEAEFLSGVANDDPFFEEDDAVLGAPSADDQLLGLVEVIYSF